MNKTAFILLLAGGFIATANHATAQGKTGCVSITEVIDAMPETKKAEDAIQQVSKENGYAFVFEKEGLHVYPPSADILPLVKKKLGLF